MRFRAYTRFVIRCFFFYKNLEYIYLFRNFAAPLYIIGIREDVLSVNFRIMTKEELMMRAIALSENSVKNGGGPFGAVIAKDGIVIAEASNSVTIDQDPTTHAEVNTIR